MDDYISNLATNQDEVDFMGDTLKAFNEIHKTPEEMRRNMVEIAKYSYEREQTSSWVAGMCFLLIDDSTKDRFQRLSLEWSNPKKDEFSLKPFQESPSGSLVLRLVNRSELTTRTAYVAVSYCWDRTDIEQYTEMKALPIDILKPGNQPNQAKAPTDVLRRSIAYAVHNNITAIWIDQECINQDDPQDKEEAIQNMDNVYQEADHAIAVLGIYLETEVEITVLASLFCEPDFPFDPSRLAILEDLLWRLYHDQWFERAWTLQESTSAGVSMVLLIACNPCVSKPPFFGTTPGEITISIWDFQEAMVYTRNQIEECLAADICPDESVANQVSNNADILWNCMPTILPDSNTRNIITSDRQVCNAAQAFAFLEDRCNSFFPDRLAILGNMCNYKRRIRTDILSLPAYGFSTCALVLAIVNGDMSLLVGYENEIQRARSKDSAGVLETEWARNRRFQKGDIYKYDDIDSDSKAYGFSWGPQPLGRLTNILYHEDSGHVFRLMPATLSETGWHLQGLLWENSSIILLPRTHEFIRPKWSQELKAQKNNHMDASGALDRSSGLGQEFVWVLLKELMELGHVELSRTIWNYYQPFGIRNGWPSPFAPLPFPLDHLFIMSEKSQHRHTPLDARELEGIQSRIRRSVLLVDLKSEVFAKPSLDRMLIEQVYNTGAINSATELGPSRTSSPRAFFAPCKLGDLVFSPASSKGDKSAFLTYATQATAWKVSRTGESVRGCEILRCVGRKSGFWRLDDLPHAEYILD